MVEKTTQLESALLKIRQSEFTLRKISISYLPLREGEERNKASVYKLEEVERSFIHVVNKPLYPYSIAAVQQERTSRIEWHIDAVWQIDKWGTFAAIPIGRRIITNGRFLSLHLLYLHYPSYTRTP